MNIEKVIFMDKEFLKSLRDLHNNIYLSSNGRNVILQYFSSRLFPIVSPGKLNKLQYRKRKEVVASFIESEFHLGLGCVM
jgi:hypothetical protein